MDFRVSLRYFRKTQDGLTNPYNPLLNSFFPIYRYILIFVSTTQSSKLTVWTMEMKLNMLSTVHYC